MDDKELNVSDLEFIIESLRYTKMAFEDYEKYPSYEYKQKRVKEAQDVIDKVIRLKKTFSEF
ncbi:hypothetical protein [Reichenbachiella sp.]|uniref:hypothetical protein n=1 Tax=Reichenbachiella sp. TaxID=2184521 RepID=UPI003BB0E514